MKREQQQNLVYLSLLPGKTFIRSKLNNTNSAHDNPNRSYRAWNPQNVNRSTVYELEKGTRQMLTY